MNLSWNFQEDIRMKGKGRPETTLSQAWRATRAEWSRKALERDYQEEKELIHFEILEYLKIIQYVYDLSKGTFGCKKEINQKIK